MKKIISLLFIVLFSLSCSPKEETIKIGLLSVFSGEGANYGKSARTAVDLAVEEINTTGGINGKKIEIVYEDSKGNPKDALNGFQKLATIDKVPIVIGPFYSGEVLSCASAANSNKVVLLSGSATSDNIKNAGDYVFRVCPTNLEQARTVADFIINDLKKKSAFIIYRNVDYGVTLRDRFKDSFGKLGGVILGEEGVVADVSDVRTQIQKAKSKKADVIFAAVHYPEGGALLKQSKELGLKAEIIGTDGGFDPQLINIASDAANGSFWATIGWGGGSTKEEKDKFIVKYKSRYNEEPNTYSGLYYDALNVIVRALTNIKEINGETVKNELYKIKDFKGATGITSFDSFGEVEKPFSIYRVENKNFVLFK